jgi:hypothetical protein
MVNSNLKYFCAFLITLLVNTVPNLVASSVGQGVVFPVHAVNAYM